VHVPWDAVHLFVVAAEERSLSRAAKVLGLTQPTVSRRLAELEAEIGEPLFVRSVGGVSLTAAGERLLDPARRMADVFGEVERAASAAAQVGPRGLVRITAPPGIAFELLAPFAVRAREVLPEVKLEVTATVRYVDLVRREADLALRTEIERTRELVVLRSIEEPIAAYATRAYAATLPRGYRIEDIGFIGWPKAQMDLPPNRQLAARIPDFEPVFTSDDFLVQLRAAEAGMGAIILSRRTSRLALSSALVELDVDLGKRMAGLHLVCARSALTIPRVRAVADLLVKELAPNARVTRKPRV
jgi:DNA-binding transcriptional LysR family regulator